MTARCVVGAALLVALVLAACSSPAEPSPGTPESWTVGDRPFALKVAVSRAGIYRVGVDPLISGGLLPPGTLLNGTALYRDGHPIPVWIDASGRTLVFYGLPPSSRYAPFAAYVLRWDSGAGADIKTERLPSAVGESPAAARIALELEENAIYLPRAVEAVSDPWFWARLAQGSPARFSFELPAAARGTASLAISLWGASASPEIEPDHRVTVSLNGTRLGKLEWDGEAAGSHSWTLPSDILAAGENQLVLAVAQDAGSTVDLSYLDWIRITCPVEAANRSDLQVATVGPGRLAPNPGDLVLDLSDPALPVRLEVPPDGGLLISERVIGIVGQGEGREPDLIVPMTESTWAASYHRADYLILAPADLSRALAPLVRARQAQGLATLLVPVEELGDEFGGGVVTPDALHNFLVRASETWARPAPRYVLLVGDATYDFRDYLGQSPRYLVPSMAVPVAFGGETLSDTVLADLDQDGRPDLSIGRWPVSDESQAEALVQRTIEYETAECPNLQALFVADTSESAFPAMSDRLIDAGDLGSDAVRLYGAVSHETIQAWNRGAWLINYVGHGSLDLWGKAGLLDIASLDELLPAECPPVVTQFTCLTGFFGHPRLTSLAEAMLQTRNGPVATIAATSLTLAANQEGFAATLIAQLANPETLRIGDALLRAQRAPGLNSSGDHEVVSTFHLLGDPALILARPD